MKIETKFDNHDHVYFLNNNTINCECIKGILVDISCGTFYSSPDKVNISYSFIIKQDIIHIPENRVFKTKEELIKSLQ